MADDPPGTVKVIDHLLARDILIGVHSDKIGNVLFIPYMRRAPKAQAPCLLLDRSSAPTEVLFKIYE